MAVVDIAVEANDALGAAELELRAHMTTALLGRAKPLLGRMRWFFGEIQTRKLCVSPTELPMLLGLVFKGADGYCVMWIILQKEYATRRDTSDLKRGGKGGLNKQVIYLNGVQNWGSRPLTPPWG